MSDTTATLRLPRRDPRSLAVASVGAAAVVGFIATADDDGPVVCLFRRCTGGYCPGCGATRATRRLVVGDVGGAWALHPWVVFAAVQALAIAALLAMTPQALRSTRFRRVIAFLAWPNLALLVVIWAVRLVDGSVPRPFG